MSRQIPLLRFVRPTALLLVALPLSSLLSSATSPSALVFFLSLAALL